MLNDIKAKPVKKILSRIAAVLLAVILMFSLAVIDTRVAFAEGGENPPTETTAPSDEPQPTETPAPSDEQPTDTPQPSEFPISTVSLELETTEVNGFECVDGEIIVKFRDSATDTSMDNVLDSVDSEVQQELPVDNMVVTDVPEGETVESFIDTMEDQPNVEYAQPNYVYSVDTVNDPGATAVGQWYLRTIGAYDAWDITMGSSSIKVAVLDTGIDLDHPELSGKVIAQYDFVNRDSSAQDDDGHGTNVAGIIAAKANNNTGIAGIAPGVQLIAVKVLNNNGEGTSARSVEGINYAVRNGARVINMSFGGRDEDTAVEDAINAAVNAGVVCVTGAGNDTDTAPYYPSDFDACISVMATDEDDNLADFSGYGPEKDICAPGEGIYSTYDPSAEPRGNYYMHMSGTSMASPMVAGVAALILSVNPSLSVDQVKDILYSTAVDLGAEGKDDFFGNGRVSAAAAVYKAKGFIPFIAGSGTESDPYEISTPDLLNEVRYFPDAHFIMTEDIDMSAATTSGAYYYSGLGWNPIELLNGSFDGNGHSITGLNITDNYASYSGLFDTIGIGGEVKNLTLKDCRITGQYYVGGIAGCVNGGSVSNCSFAGTVNGYGMTGGIAGECYGGTITGCANSGSVTGYNYTGGITGRICGAVSECYNTGRVESKKAYVGGITGSSGFDDEYTGTNIIEKCYNSGSVISGDPANGPSGGIAGYSRGTVLNCFNTGILSAGVNAGGIAGNAAGSVSCCYNLGNMGISGNASVASDSFYLKREEADTAIIAKTAEQLLDQSTYTGYDFENVWSIESGRYPVLRDVPFVSVTGVSLPDQIKIKLNQTSSLTATFTPADAANRNVTWSSNDTSAATVSENGTVKLIKNSAVTITATSQDGGYSDTCNIIMLPEYTINAYSNNTAYGTVIGGKVCDEGSPVSLTPIPSLGYRFVRWMENGSELSKAVPYTFTASVSRTITAEFAKIGTPSKPTGVSADYNKAVVSWSAVEGAAGYDVWRSTSAFGSYTNVGTQTGTTFTNTGLKAGTTYYFRVSAYCTAGNARTSGSLSDYAAVRPVPLAPASCSASAVDYDSIKIEWRAVSAASGYMVYRSTSENGTYSKIATTTRTYYTNNGVYTGTRYYYRVRAYYSSTSIYGDYSPFGTAVTSLEPMKNITAVTYFPTSIKISWSAVPGRTRYEISRSLTGAEGSFVSYKTTTSTYFKDTGLAVDTKYYYKVTAYRTVSGKKVYNAASPAVSDTARVFQVTGFNAFTYSVTSNKITWGSVTGASGYEVSRCDAAGNVTLVLYPVTSRTYFYDKTITAGQTYYYKVRAYRIIGGVKKFGAYSILKTCESKMQGIKAYKYTASSNKISWGSISGRYRYEIWRSDSAEKAPSYWTETTSTYIYDKSIDPAKTYYYKVRAYILGTGGVKIYCGFSDTMSVAKR